MFGLGLATKIYIAVEAIDMRKGFEGLHGLVRDHLKQDPLSGQVFVFLNRRRNRIKLLVWDRTGYLIVYKRLEIGTFRFPQAEAAGVEIRAADLQMLLDGIDLASVKRQKRYRRPVADVT